MKRKTRRKIFIAIGTLCLLAGCAKTDIKQAVEIAADAYDTTTAILDLSEDTEMVVTIEEATETSSETGLQEVMLIRVVDGDTIVVENNGNEEKVRLIGIDTPESVHYDESKNNEQGESASEYTKRVLADAMTVYLQYDESRTDKYGRTLAYVWLSDDVDLYDTESIRSEMLNGILVGDGYAFDKVYAPNDMYADVFAELRQDAQNNERGLWSYDDFKALWN